MRRIAISLFYLSLIIISTYAGSTAEWKKRTIYQLLTDRYAIGNGSKPNCNPGANTYCGGNFQGITKNLDYIKGMGFDAIWISPVVVNYPNGYHGYWAKDILNINPYFGTAQDLKDLVSACHKKGIWVMVDVVANHMGNTNTDFSPNVPFNQASNYHDWCNVDSCGTDQSCKERCRLANLADLKQEDSWVTQQLLNWIKNLVTNYNLDGLRIDTVPYVPKSFWSQFTTASGVYEVGEIWDYDMSYVAGYVPSISAVLNYPSYLRLKDVFLGKKDMYNVRQQYTDWYKVTNDISAYGLFTDNHDNPRFLSYCTWNGCLALYKSWIAFTLTSIGIPIIYYGTEQLFNGGNDPWDREALWNNMNTNSDTYKYIATINAARQKLQSFNQPQVESYCDAQFFAYYRGQFLVAITNVFSSQVQRNVTTHPFKNGEKVCNIFWPTQDCLTIQNGVLTVYLNQGEAKIFVPAATASELANNKEEIFSG